MTAKWQHPTIFEAVVRMQRLRIKVEKLKLQAQLNSAQRLLKHQVKKINDK